MRFGGGVIALGAALIVGAHAPASAQYRPHPHLCSPGEVHANTGFDPTTWPESLRRGDTIGVARDIANTVLFCPTDTFWLSVLLPFLRDSAHAALLGLGDLPYENIIRKLAEYPSAVSGDTGELSCTPEACALLKRQWTEATDPRLRDVGLVALMAADPARWADTIISLAERERGDELLREPAARLRGIYSSSVGSMPMPRPDANWHQWLVWARGFDPPLERPGAPPNFDTWRGEREEGVRLFQIRTGRDFVTEWRADLAAAPNDTARYLFETLLAPWRGGWDPPATSVIEAQLRTGDALSYARAALAISEMFRRSGGPPDARTVAEIADTALAVVINGKPFWKALPLKWDPERQHSWPIHDWSKAGALAALPSRTIYAYVADLPPAVRKRWGSRVTWIDDSTWSLPPGQNATALIDIGPIQRAGPFLKVSWALHTFDPDSAHGPIPFVDARYRHDVTFVGAEGRWLMRSRGSTPFGEAYRSTSYWLEI